MDFTVEDAEKGKIQCLIFKIQNFTHFALLRETHFGSDLSGLGKKSLN